MATLNRNVARNDLARAFIFERGVFRCNALGEFVSCLAVDALAQDRGDVTSVECPSPTRYGEFIEIASLPGELSRLTTTLTGRMSRTEVSTFYQLFIGGCNFDLHLHFGLCQQPDAFNQFDKALIFENVSVTAFSTEPLIALQSADRAVINESIDISVGNFYEVVNLNYGLRGQNVTVDTAVISVNICDSKSCGGDCEDSSSGCEKIFAATTDYNVYVSADGGATWATVVVDATPPVGGVVVDAACFRNQYVLIDDQDNFYFAEKSDLLESPGTATFGTSLIGLGTDAAAAIDAIAEYGIVVGEAGNVAMFTSPESGATIVDAGFATVQNLNAVHVTDEVSIAGGAAGVVLYSTDGELWFAASVVNAGANAITAVLAKSRQNWIVGTANGKLWCTDNGGRTWALVSYPGSGTNTAEINDLAKATGHVLYMVTDDKLFRTIDGGASWITEPNSTQNFPTNVEQNSVSVCSADPNYVITGGEAAGLVGVLILGTPG